MDLETLRTPVRVAESAAGVEGEGGGEQVGGRHTEGQMVGDEKQRSFVYFLSLVICKSQFLSHIFGCHVSRIFLIYIV